MSIDPAAIAAQLGQPVRLKTWSLIVTIFGDAVLPHGGEINASALNDITSAMGVNAGAVRTALSRLAADGIIERQRDGRNSAYRLSPDREQEFLAASDRIYASAEPVAKTGDQSKTYLLVAALGGDAPLHGAIRLSREWWLMDGNARDDLLPDCAIFEGEFSRLPDWLTERVASPELADAMRQVQAIFGPISSKLQSDTGLDPIKALATRCLLIHAWRRIALRLRPLPDGFAPPDWPEDKCRHLVAALYKQLQTADRCLSCRDFGKR